LVSSGIAVGEASITLRSSTTVLPLLQFLGELPLVAAQFGERRNRVGVDAGQQPIGFLALIVRAEQTARAAGQIGHVRAPLVEDQVEAGAQAVPALLERRDARVAAADFGRDRAGRKCLL
jgi:hypothetical protein